MIRAILFYIIPFIFPFVVYGVYLYFNSKAGGDKSWGKNSIAVAMVTGLLLMAVSLIVLGIVSGDPRKGTVYVPPRFEDGKIIDSQVIPAEKKE